ncbi:MAG TPA: hypothetical protein VG389_00645 [Myxococcota bacterium]|jgi:hypothetical protein|nr:hypothetical protein [Myxococcota bacterium]
MTCAEVQERRADYAVGEVSDAERAAIEAHLRDTDAHECHRAIARARTLAGLLPVALDRTAAAPGLWEGIEARLDTDGAADVAARREARDDAGADDEAAAGGNGGSRSSRLGAGPPSVDTSGVGLRPFAGAYDEAPRGAEGWRWRAAWGLGGAAAGAAAMALVAAVLWIPAGPGGAGGGGGTGVVTGGPRTGDVGTGGATGTLTAAPVPGGLHAESAAELAALRAALAAPGATLLTLAPLPAAAGDLEAGALAVVPAASGAETLVFVTGVAARPGVDLQVLVERQGGMRSVVLPRLRALGEGAWLGSFDAGALGPPPPARLVVRRVPVGGVPAPAAPGEDVLAGAFPRPLLAPSSAAPTPPAPRR